MEKNKQSLLLARIALIITLVIWFLGLTIFLFYTYFLLPIFFLYIIPTILNIIIFYEKDYRKFMILATLCSYIVFGIITIAMAPFLLYIITILFLPQTICLTLACLTFKKIKKN